MSDQELKTGESSSAPVAVDEIKNMKAEFNRKLENQNSQLQQLLSELQKKPVSSETAGKKISVFDDEDAYARQIEERAEQKISAKLAEREKVQQRYQSVIQGIISEYPEASEQSSPLMLRAQEIYANLADDDKSHPLAMKAAVTSAAAELGVKPKSKRQSDTSSDDFSLSGSSSNPSSSKRGRSEIDPVSEEWAARLGIDLSDPKNKEMRENIKNKHGNKRRSYNDWG